MRIAWTSLLCAFGSCVLVWSVVATSCLWSGLESQHLSEQILAGGRFRPGVLAEFLRDKRLKQSEFLARASLVRAEAIIEMRIGEEATERGVSSYGDADIQRLGHALTLNSTDSFLWFTLYLTETRRNGFDAAKLGYLQQSYVTGPREGWFAPRRNRISLSSFSWLGDALQEQVTKEFSDLLGGDLVEDAALNLTSAGWAQRSRLLASLESVPKALREELADRLVRQGVVVEIPGVEIRAKVR